MANSDNSRFNLVTRFSCVKCGTGLQLSYDGPKTEPYDPEKADGITGSKKLQQRVFIHPCTKCYSEALRPLEALRDALAAAPKV